MSIVSVRASRLVGALVVLIGVAGCVAPSGSPVELCDDAWEPVTVQGGTTVTGDLESHPIECYRVIAEQRLEVGILMPPGPECYAVDFVDVIESDDAVSLEVVIGSINNPLGGACPPEALPWGVPVELNGPAEGRRILDASRPAG
jgi:hypothetical protein